LRALAASLLREKAITHLVELTAGPEAGEEDKSEDEERAAEDMADAGASEEIAAEQAEVLAAAEAGGAANEAGAVVPEASETGTDIDSGVEEQAEV
jgi:hypothetical protein